MTRTLAEFPNVVCWVTESRAEVMNTMALDVRPEIFVATHYPSLALDTNETLGSTERLNENEYAVSFVDNREPHVLDFAVGDSGVGKSHFIRWVYHLVTNLPGEAETRHCIKLIPRSSANLADIVLDLIRDFHGEAIDRVRKELAESQHRTTVEGAAHRVLDEYAFVLDPATQEAQEVTVPEGVQPALYRDVLALIPAMLRDQAIRDWFIGRSDSIVVQMAHHLSSRRENREDLDGIASKLAWRASDLAIEPTVYERSGDKAKELASALLSDDDAREVAAYILRDSFAEVSAGLLGLKRGDLRRAIIEIRRQLKSLDQELVLLIEDMSVAHGLDRDLLEALVVRTRDAGEDEICKLRAIVGLTNDDYARLPDNIKGRTRKTLSFNVRFSHLANTDDDHIGRQGIVDFASRYLNAARYGAEELERWFSDSGATSAPTSYCTTHGCPNTERCHRVFGQVDGRGLYPFTEETLVRLYRQTIADCQGDLRAFNPRVMVAEVLNALLEEAETNLPNESFPTPALTASFSLQATTADLSDRLQQVFQSEPGIANRLLAAVELYAENPSTGALPPGIAEAFSLPLTLPTERREDAEGTHQKPEATTEGGTKKPKAVDHGETSLDDFDRWARGSGKDLSQRILNEWRGYVYDAIRGYIDWDGPGLAAVAEHFQRQYINFEGQVPNPRPGGMVTLEVPRTDQVALALRGLKNRFAAPEEKDCYRMAELAGQMIRKWSATVLAQLRQIAEWSVAPPPIELAAQYLAMGAIVRNQLPSNADDAEALTAALAPWPEQEIDDGAKAWKQLWRAYRDHAPPLREWLAKQLSCSKGGMTGGFIDPTPVLDAIREVRSTGCAKTLPDSVGGWPEYFGPVKKLADAVQRCLNDAIVQESQQAIDCEQRLRGLVAGEDFSELCNRLCDVVKLAAALDVLGKDTATAFESECRSVGQDKGQYEAFIEVARVLEQMQDPGTQLRAIASIDRPFVANLICFLNNALQRSRGALARAKSQIGLIPSLDDLKTKIDKRIKTIRKYLADLTGNTEEQG